MNRLHPAWFWGGVVAAFIAALYFFRPILLPFVVGMLLAYLLNPPVNRLSRMGIGRMWGSVLVLLLAFFVLVGALLLIAPLLQEQVVQLINQLPDLLTGIRDKAAGLLDLARSRVSPETAAKIQESVGGMAGDLAGNATKFVGGVLAGLWSGGFALVNILSLIFITPLVAFYLLDDWERIVATIDGYIPRRHMQTVRDLAREIDTNLAGYVRGVSMICVILAIFYGTALTMAGLEFGLVIGLLAGLMSFVPFVGAVFGFIASVGLAVVQFSDIYSILLVAGIFIIGQVIEGNVLQPWLVGRQVNLHAVWIIFALLAGGALFGFVGVLLGVPVAVVASVLIRFGLRRYRESPLYRTVPQPPGTGEPPGGSSGSDDASR